MMRDTLSRKPNVIFMTCTTSLFSILVIKLDFGRNLCRTWYLAVESDLSCVSRNLKETSGVDNNKPAVRCHTSRCREQLALIGYIYRLHRHTCTAIRPLYVVPAYMSNLICEISSCQKVYFIVYFIRLKYTVFYDN